MFDSLGLRFKPPTFKSRQNFALGLSPPPPLPQPTKFWVTYLLALKMPTAIQNTLWRVKRSALRLWLTGLVEQPMSCYGLLT